MVVQNGAILPKGLFSTGVKQNFLFLIQTFSHDYLSIRVFLNLQGGIKSRRINELELSEFKYFV